MRLARVYEDVAPGDGQRVLVDRLWPRGVHRDDPRAGLWCKDVAPSNELRRWYGHDPARHAEFVRRYLAELAEPEANSALVEVRGLAAEGPVTLVTATKELALSHLRVLEKVLEER